MCEILFRGKRLDSEEWVEGYFYSGAISGCFILQNKLRQRRNARTGEILMGDEVCPFEVDPSTVGQYTGLKDKNGNPIYEGHIVKCRHIFIDAFEKIKEKNPRKSYGKEIEEMAYGDFQCRYWRNYAVSFHDGGIRMQNGSDTCYLKQSYIRNHEVEIIGNIHDNPELLKGGQDNG